MAYDVGVAFVRIVPSFRGIEKDLQAGAQKIADGIDKQIQKTLPKSFGKAIRDGVSSDVAGASRRAASGMAGAGRKAAEDFTDAFNAGLRGRLRAVESALPKLTITGDSTDVEKALDRVRRQAVSLSEQTIGVDIDGRTAIAAVRQMNDELRRLEGQATTVELRMDIARGRRELDQWVEDVRVATEVAGRQSGRSFARIFRSGVLQAADPLPEVEIDADTDPAQAELVKLRRYLADLSQLIIGVDVDAPEALDRLDRIRERLRDLSTNADNLELRIDADQSLQVVDGVFDRLTTQAEKAADQERKRQQEEARRAAEQAAKEAARLAQIQERERKRGAEQAAREAARLAREQERDRKRQEEKARRDQERADREAAREAKAQAKDRERELKRQQDEARREAEQAARDAEKLFGQTWAGQIRERVADALRQALLATELGMRPAQDADEQRVRDLQSLLRGQLPDAMRTLHDQRIGIDVDVDDAIAQVTALREQLEQLARLTPNVQVQADAIAAAAELAAIERMAEQIDSRQVRLQVESDADRVLNNVGQAAEVSLSHLERLIFTSLSLGTVLVPAAAAASSAIGFIGAAAVSATSGIGVMLLGFSGIGEAVQQLEAYNDDLDKSQASLARSGFAAASAADAIASAERSLANVRASNAEAARRSARAVEDAERAVGRAQEARREATEALTKAIEDEHKANQNIGRDLERLEIEQRQALVDQAEAKEELDRLLANPRATQIQRDQAKVTYDEITLRIKDLGDEQKELQEQQEEYARNGVDNSDRVRAAQDRVADANRRVEDSQRRLADAAVAQQSQQRQASFALVNAQEALERAHRQAGQAAVTASVAGGEALDNLNDAMEDLSPAGREFAEFLFGLKDEVLSLRDAAQENMLPGVQSAIENLLPFLPRFRDYVGRVANSVGGLFDETSRFLTADRTWRRFWTYTDATTVPTMERLWRIGRNLSTGLVALYLAFTPFTEDVGAGIEGLTASFAEWGEQLEHSARFADFLDYVRESIPRVLGLVGELTTFMWRFVQAAAPVGTVVAAAFTLFFELLNAIPMPVLQAIVIVIGAWSAGLTALAVAGRLAAINQMLVARAARAGHTAFSAGLTVQDAYNESLSRSEGRSRAAATALGGLNAAARTARLGMSGLVTFLGGPWTIAIGAAVVAASYLTSQWEEQRARVDDLQTSLSELGTAYRESGDLSNESVQAAVLQNDLLRDLAANASAYGVSLEAVAKAAAGERAAQSEVVDVLREKLALIDAEIESREYDPARRALADIIGERGARLFDDDDLKGLREQRGEIETLIDGLEGQFDAADKAAAATRALDREQRSAAASAKPLESTQLQLSEALSFVAETASAAVRQSDLLRRAHDNLHGAAIAASEAEEAYEASVARMSEELADNRDAIVGNAQALSVSTELGRANRDLIQDRLAALREMYFADVASGVAVSEASKKHADNIEVLVEEATKAGLLEGDVRNLIAVYGQIPAKVTTEVTTKGVAAAKKQLEELQIAQYALSQGIPVDQATKEWRKARQRADSLTGAGGLAEGGPVRGPGTGTSDSIPAWLSNGEWVQPAATVRYYGTAFMEALRRRMIPRDAFAGRSHDHAGGYAYGGLVEWPFPVTASRTRIPTMDEVAAVAAATAGSSAGGIGSANMMRILRAVFPGLPLYSGFRPGSRTASGSLSYHARIAANGQQGRAVDVPPDMSVFNWIRANYRNSRELIFSPAGSRQIWNGQPHIYSEPVRSQHYDHIHWAYDSGGWLPPGVSTVVNATGRPEPVFSPGQWDQMSTLIRQTRGGYRVEHHWHFREAALDMDRLQAWQDRQDALARIDRPA